MYLFGLYYFVLYVKLVWIPDVGSISATEYIYVCELLHVFRHHWHLRETRIHQEVFCKNRPKKKRIQEYYYQSSCWRYNILQTFNSRDLITLKKEQMHCHSNFFTLIPESGPIFIFFTLSSSSNSLFSDFWVI